MTKLSARLKLNANGNYAIAWAMMFTAAIFRGAADGRDSSGPKPRHWCLQKEISVSAIRRGHRKKPRWLCFDAGKRGGESHKLVFCCINN